ncbi:CPBP family intramembrane glutamic endopeptidase [Leifsonia poae]|uniref:CPBP family intramembrane glutamic endopeptidase n=1 Tax=Leifsonia poae TaxID=110933 RepID=UPI003D67069B
MTELRVRPRVWIGLAICAAYLVVVFLIQLASGIPYTAWGDSAENLFLGADISLIVAGALLAITTSVLGWWRPALVDEHRSRYAWPIVAPALFALLAVVNLALTDWGSVGTPFIGAAALLLLVGFTEELTIRGLLLVALRSRLAEGWVWFLSSLIFALLHGVNVLLGADLFGTIEQMLFAFAVGSAYYIVRRVTGSLIPAMILHAVWDFSVFMVTQGHPTDLAQIVNAVIPIAGLLTLVCVPFVIRGTARPAAALRSGRKLE